MDHIEGFPKTVTDVITRTPGLAAMGMAISLSSWLSEPGGPASEQHKAAVLAIVAATMTVAGGDPELTEAALAALGAAANETVLSRALSGIRKQTTDMAEADESALSMAVASLATHVRDRAEPGCGELATLVASLSTSQDQWFLVSAIRMATPIGQFLSLADRRPFARPFSPGRLACLAGTHDRHLNRTGSHDMPATRHIGGSIMPSSNRQILQPMETPFGTLQVRPLPDLDTHGLFLRHEKGESCLAMHPNGHTCHELAKRMHAGNIDKSRQQIDYILACGGMAMRADGILSWLPSPEPEADDAEAAPAPRGPGR